jgi:hypothetical protein
MLKMNCVRLVFMTLLNYEMLCTFEKEKLNYAIINCQRREFDDIQGRITSFVYLSFALFCLSFIRSCLYLICLRPS